MKKICSKCKKTKARSCFCFFWDKRGKRKIKRTHSWCKDCVNKYNNIHRDKKKKREYNKKYYLLYPEKIKLKNKNCNQNFYRVKNFSKIVKGIHSIREWEKLKKRYNYTCLRCKKREPEVKLVRDHIIDITPKLAIDYIWNIQPLCIGCNLHKIKNKDYR